MADPQPKPATAKELIGEQINAWGTFDYDRLPEEVLAETILSTLTAAGFRIVPPGWDVVKLAKVTNEIADHWSKEGPDTPPPPYHGCKNCEDEYVWSSPIFTISERWDG